jgi:beta-glucosidase
MLMSKAKLFAWQSVALAALGCSSNVSVTKPPAPPPPPPAPSAEAVISPALLKGEAKVSAWMKELTLDEKLKLVAGTGFDTTGIERLGIPQLRMTDGPIGVRKGKATRFLSTVGMAATFDPSVAEQVGKAIGQEVRAHGLNVLLAPCVNIHRTPLGGRNFESYGEDPVLAAKMSTAYIRGVQSQKVVATVKHFAVNNQETDRMTVDVRIDERTLHELYLPAFDAAVHEAKVQAVMCAYNRINGPYACENTYLLKDTLRERWAFQGLVMSDWRAVHSTAPSVRAGTDLEMPDAKYYTPALLRAALQEKTIDQSELDEMVRRQLRVIVHMGLDEPTAPTSVETIEAANRVVNRNAASASFVLLKNEKNFLPLDASKLKRVVVIGPSAKHIDAGGGSAHVDATREVTLLDALRTRLGTQVSIEYLPGMDEAMGLEVVPVTALRGPANQAPGLYAEYFDNAEFKGTPKFARQDTTVDFRYDLDGPTPDMPKDEFSIRWTGSLTAPETGKYLLAIESDDGSRVYIDDQLVIDNWGGHPPVLKANEVAFQAGVPRRIRIDYYESIIGASVSLKWKRIDPTMLPRAKRAAAAADVVIVAVGNDAGDETEGRDRERLELPRHQAELVRSIAESNPRTLVVLSGGSPVELAPFLGRVRGALMTWFPGQEAGDAMTDVLFGDVSPSGRLPFTWPKRRADAPDAPHFPGANGTVHYAEGMLVGYRYYDTKAIAPLFPFGYGLSYSKFEYRNLSVSAPDANGEVSVNVVVKNTGTRAAAEVVQAYVHPIGARLPRPEQELKGFVKVAIPPGEERPVQIGLGARAFSIYDVEKHDWSREPGQYEVRVGGSSREQRLTQVVTIK